MSGLALIASQRLVASFTGSIGNKGLLRQYSVALLLLSNQVARHSPILKWYARSSIGRHILVCSGASSSELEDLVEKESDARATALARNIQKVAAVV